MRKSKLSAAINTVMICYKEGKRTLWCSIRKGYLSNYLKEGSVIAILKLKNKK